jgi:HemY protein
VRVCLLMADLEETQGSPGAVREWLARAARAPRDRAWIADGFVSDRWAPVSPAGKLDAFVWRTPEERLSAPGEVSLAEAPALVEDPAEAPEIAEPPAAIERPSAPPILEAAPEPAGAKIVAITPAAVVAKAPDDPGVHPAAAKRSGFRLFS